MTKTTKCLNEATATFIKKNYTNRLSHKSHGNYIYTHGKPRESNILIHTGLLDIWYCNSKTLIGELNLTIGKDSDFKIGHQLKNWRNRG